MEQNQSQPLKKRIIEQPSIYSPQTSYVNSSTSPQDQRLSQLGQSCQYVPLGELKPQQQQCQPIQPGAQIIQYEYYESPMTLNVWTQTSPEEFPNTPPSIDPIIEVELLAKIQRLEGYLRAQTIVLNEMQRSKIKSPPREEVISNPTNLVPSEMKQEGTTYRILAESSEATNEAQIEIQLSDNADSVNTKSSSPRVYTLCTNSKSIAEQIYAPNIDKSLPRRSDSGSSMVSIGPNDTKIPAAEFEKLSWASASIATRKLLTIIFSRETLATHSMTGKASPAFKDLDKPVKGRLNPDAINDIIFIVSNKCAVSAKEVRSAITTKCADENKMMKLKLLKQSGLHEPKRSALAELNKRKSGNKENP